MRLAVVLTQDREFGYHTCRKAMAIHPWTPQDVFEPAPGVFASVSRPSGVKQRVILDGWMSLEDEVLGHPSDVRRLVPTLEGAVVVAMANSTIVGVRDRLGTRPLHFGQVREDCTILASEIKQLVKVGVDDVQAVPPGGGVTLRASGEVDRTEPSWEVPRESVLDDTRIRRLRDALARSVRQRSDGPMAVALSGGLDSSSVLALARDFRRDVVAVSVGLPDSDDLTHAVRLSEDLGVDLVTVEPKVIEDPLAMLQALVERLETWESQVLTHAVPTTALLENVADLDRTLLTGEGSDELFAGYRSHTDSQAYIERRRVWELSNFSRTSAQRLDRLAHHHGVTVRLPLAANDVVSAALSFSGAELVGERLNKRPLRAAMEDLLPEYVLDRPKKTFARGAGYKYGSHAHGGGLFTGLLNDCETDLSGADLPDGLARGRVELASLSHFMQLGYHAAGYMMTRTL